MVQLTEVEDEHFQNQKEVEYDDEDFTDTGKLLNVFLLCSFFSIAFPFLPGAVLGGGGDT